MKLVIISGRSGSGKSTALNLLEDCGFYCIDNLPATLLPELARITLASPDQEARQLAVCIDARNAPEDLAHFPALLEQLPKDAKPVIVYLDALDSTLIKRFSETRRPHPLSNEERALQEAIHAERDLLEPIAHRADLMIDTSHLNLYSLRDVLRKRLVDKHSNSLSILFESFAYRRGVPIDADLVFDVRCLPNPYWDPELRHYSGLDKPVIDFLDQQEPCQRMFHDIRDFLEHWLPRYSESDRHYLTIAIGCTGGQHRSVYLCEKLGQHFSANRDNVQIRHRELVSLQMDKH
ncbi:MAG: RNase adapter RapZ [Gammaproteobacteria bacterium]|nr:MAG: RNase adapter RapZ [Gammaproteobacteria bacterium]